MRHWGGDHSGPTERRGQLTESFLGVHVHTTGGHNQGHGGHFYIELICLSTCLCFAHDFIDPCAYASQNAARLAANRTQEWRQRERLLMVPGLLGGCGWRADGCGCGCVLCGGLDPCALPLRTSLALRIIGPLSGAVRPAAAECISSSPLHCRRVCACSSQQHSFAAFSSSAATHTRSVRREPPVRPPLRLSSAAAQRPIAPGTLSASRSAACAVSACVSVCSASRCLSPA